MSVLYPERKGAYVYLFMMKCLHTGCLAFSISMAKICLWSHSYSTRKLRSV